MWHIIIGLLLMALGVLIIVKSEWMLYNFGRIGFFEQHLGIQGGSRLGYKLVGLIFVFAGLLIAVGLFGGLIEWIFSPLIKYQEKSVLQ